MEAQQLRPAPRAGKSAERTKRFFWDRRRGCRPMRRRIVDPSPTCDRRPSVFHRPPSFPHQCACQHRSVGLCQHADPCWSSYYSPLLYTILVKFNPSTPAYSPFDAASALDVVTRYREDDVLRDDEWSAKFETCACFRKAAHGATENRTVM
jgi:hypothetical protein